MYAKAVIPKMTVIKKPSLKPRYVPAYKTVSKVYESQPTNRNLSFYTKRPERVVVSPLSRKKDVQIQGLKSENYALKKQV